MTSLVITYPIWRRTKHVECIKNLNHVRRADQRSHCYYTPYGNQKPYRRLLNVRVYTVYRDHNSYFTYPLAVYILCSLRETISL